MSWTRRAFVAGAGAFFGVATVSGGVALTGLPAQEWLRWRILREVTGVTFAEGTVEAFVAAFLAAEAPQRVLRVTTADLVTKVLLSTDFFDTGAEPSRPARFVALFGSGCRNPLARF